MYSVMLVDDDQPVLDFLSAMIPWDELGFTLHSACKNGLVALEKAGADMPDIVITDIGMPYMDGLELIRELKMRSGEVRVVVLSCMDDFTYAQQAVKLMVSDYILKETMSRELIITLLRELGGELRRRDEEKAQTLKWKSMAEHQKGLLKQRVLERIIARELPGSEWQSDAAELGLKPELTAHVAVLCRISGDSGDSAGRSLGGWPWRHRRLSRCIRTILLSYACPTAAVIVYWCSPAVWGTGQRPDTSLCWAGCVQPFKPCRG